MLRVPWRGGRQVLSWSRLFESRQVCLNRWECFFQVTELSFEVIRAFSLGLSVSCTMSAVREHRHCMVATIWIWVNLLNSVMIRQRRLTSLILSRPGLKFIIMTSLSLFLTISIMIDGTCRHHEKLMSTCHLFFVVFILICLITSKIGRIWSSISHIGWNVSYRLKLGLMVLYIYIMIRVQLMPGICEINRIHTISLD